MRKKPTRLDDPAARWSDSARSTAFTWLLIRGILAVLVGILLFFAPVLGALTITLVIGLWLILDGIASVVLALRQRGARLRWGTTLVGGIVAVVVGLLVVIFPASVAIIGGLFALWALAIGLLIRGLVELFNRTLGGWHLVLGVIHLVFAVVLGALLFTNAEAALLALVWVAAVYAVVFGLFTLLLAVRVRRG